MSAHAHAHDSVVAAQDPVAVARRRQAMRLMLLLLIPLALGTVVGLAVLWPGGRPSAAERAATGYFSAATTFPQATVLRLGEQACSDASPGRREICGAAVVRVDDGVDRGALARVDLPPDAVASGVSVGSQLVLSRDPGQDGGPPTYQFADFARGTPIIALAIAFALVVGVVARLRGLAALVALGFAFLVLLKFMLPALLADESPTMVTLVGSAAIMFVVLYFAHGISVRTTTALLGTLFGLALVAALGSTAVHLARLTGFSSEATVQLQQLDPTLNFSGLVIAGVVVAGLGVLNDVTVTQASAVWELSEASPRLGRRTLFDRGMAIGRDHIASTIYTIVFAYAGASLPLLMLFEIYRRPAWTILTGALVAEEIIRILVGAIALVLAVPVTTLIGAVFASLSRRAAPAPPAHVSSPTTVAASSPARSAAGQPRTRGPARTSPGDLSADDTQPTPRVADRPRQPGPPLRPPPPPSRLHHPGSSGSDSDGGRSRHASNRFPDRSVGARGPGAATDPEKALTDPARA